MVKSLNDVYKHQELFFWCNSTGDIRMPGDGEHYVVHKPTDLPPAVRQLYEAYQTETGECMRHVVSYAGAPGMLLAALYDKSYYRDICDDNGIKDLTTAQETILMDVAYQLLSRRANEMMQDPVFAGCTCFVGYNTDPDGHELGLFVPLSVVEGIDNIDKHFCQCLYPEADKTLIAQAMRFAAPEKR